MTAAPLPSFNELSLAGQRPRESDAPKRLFWSLEGPLESNIFVLDDPAQPEGPRQPYFQQTLAGTTWHPISQEPMTRPGVSSITVGAGAPLDYWSTAWADEHRHADPDDGESVWEGSWLVHCRCGEDVPPEAPSLVVEASDKPYVTVHDYVTAVHPWLLSLRQNIVSAMSVFNPLPAGTKLAVGCTPVKRVNIKEEREWIRAQARPRPVAPADQRPIDWLSMFPSNTAP